MANCWHNIQTKWMLISCFNGVFHVALMSNTSSVEAAPPTVPLCCARTTRLRFRSTNHSRMRSDLPRMARFRALKDHFLQVKRREKMWRLPRRHQQSHLLSLVGLAKPTDKHGTSLVWFAMYEWQKPKQWENKVEKCIACLPTFHVDLWPFWRHLSWLSGNPEVAQNCLCLLLWWFLSVTVELVPRLLPIINWTNNFHTAITSSQQTTRYIGRDSDIPSMRWMTSHLSRDGISWRSHEKTAAWWWTAGWTAAGCFRRKRCEKMQEWDLDGFAVPSSLKATTLQSMEGHKPWT